MDAGLLTRQHSSFAGGEGVGAGALVGAGLGVEIGEDRVRDSPAGIGFDGSLGGAETGIHASGSAMERGFDDVGLRGSGVCLEGGFEHREGLCVAPLLQSDFGQPTEQTGNLGRGQGAFEEPFERFPGGIEISLAALPSAGLGKIHRTGSGAHAPAAAREHDGDSDSDEGGQRPQAVEEREHRNEEGHHKSALPFPPGAVGE
ncbi:MAG: hypothetical protein R2729_06375 [Bryobacteraceae bacterium]